MLKTFKFMIVFLFIPWVLQAQVEIAGNVKNAQTGKPLRGANVVLKNGKAITATNVHGDFLFSNVKKGDYSLKITFVGFKTYQRLLHVDKTVHVAIGLKPTALMSDEVIISALRAGDKTPSTHLNLSGEQIRQENSGQDLPYLLKMTPSVVVSSDAGAGVGYTSVRIRGVDLTGINVTLNGIPVNDAESQGVYFVDLPDVASSVDNIQIQRGVGTSTNGSAAFGASINIKTDHFNTTPYTTLNSSAGSFNTFKNTLNFGTGLLNKHWLVSGRLSQIRSDGYIDRAFSNLRSAYLSAGYYGKKDVIKWVGMWGHERTYQAWYGVPKDSLKTNRTYNPAGKIEDANGNLLGYYDNQTDNYTQNYFQLHYAHSFNNRLNFASAAFLTRGYGYYESYKNNQQFSDYGMSDTLIGNDTIKITNLIRQKWLNNYFYGFIASANYKSERFNLTVGGGWNNYDGDHYGKIRWAQIARLGDYDRNWYFNTGKKSEFNLYGKMNYHLSEQLNIMADLQYRGIAYRIVGTHDDLRTLTQSHTFGFFNPKAGIYYTINAREQAYFSFGIANREPNRSVYRDADPNQDVRSERLSDYELGYKFSTAKLSVHTTLFYMDYKDQLVLTGKINNVGSAIMTNVPKSYRMGVEMAGDWKISQKLNWQLNATYSQNKILHFTEYIDNWNYWDNPDHQPYQYEKLLGTTDISFSPSLTAGSILTWKIFNHFDVRLLSKYVSRQYIDNTSNSERSLNPYWINNLHLSYTVFPHFLKQIDFSIQLNNLVNVQYETNAWVYRYVYNGVEQEMNGYFPQAGFHFMVGIQIKL